MKVRLSDDGTYIVYMDKKHEADALARAVECYMEHLFDDESNDPRDSIMQRLHRELNE